MDRKLILVAAADHSVTGQLVVEHAHRRHHHVELLPSLTGAIRVGGADAIVLIPRRGDPERHAHAAARILIAAARREAARAHVLLVSSFGVGYGPEHPFNRVMGLLPGMAAAESAVRSSGLPFTIVRSTWLTDDPAGAHGLTFSQHPRVDGMLSRGDLAATLVAAIERPAARGRTFALFNEPGSATRSWSRSFARLVPDSPVAVA
jgi:uncharacterized protein YbjT (DUF2867 family)